MKKKRTAEEKQEFVNKYFVTCKYCGYNNERGRFLQYGTCLKCGHVLDEKTYFKIIMLKKMRSNKRKNS